MKVLKRSQLASSMVGRKPIKIFRYPFYGSYKVNYHFHNVLRSEFCELLRSSSRCHVCFVVPVVCVLSGSAEAAKMQAVKSKTKLWASILTRIRSDMVASWYAQEICIWMSSIQMLLMRIIFMNFLSLTRYNDADKSSVKVPKCKNSWNIFETNFSGGFTYCGLFSCFPKIELMSEIRCGS